MTEDGSPYKGQHTFTCTAQVDGFKQLFEHMASYPQDYVSGRGRLTTNAVEGFHGLALLYRNKKTDLGHTHYTCKTNMSICHKVIIAFLSKVFDAYYFGRILVLSGECSV